MPIALLALTLSAFAIGTTEFVIVGLLPTIGADLGVSLPSAGLLVSLYALGVAIGAPVLTALTGKVPRKMLLLSLMVLFTLGNLLAWKAPSYESLNIAAFNLGIAGGAWGGGLIVAHIGLIHTVWIGGLVVLVALALTAWSGRLDRLGPVYAEPAEGSTRIVAGH
ncbi:MFS transporter [Pseudomonas sp. NPDC098740]|uniref:MFS transporter n=1 Tax=Pseudomonas sp. NPDC098740 TaxID=3364486 RepID=UPI00383AD99C